MSANRGQADITMESRDVRCVQQCLRRTQENLKGRSRDSYQNCIKVQARDQESMSCGEVQVNSIKQGGLGTYERATNWSFY